MLTVRPHIREQCRPLRDHLVPERQRVHDPVRLRRRCHVTPPRPRELERVVRDAAHPDTGEYRLLDGHLVGEAAVEPPTDLAVLTLDVLADHDEVDLAGGPQWALDTVEHLDRSQV